MGIIQPIFKNNLQGISMTLENIDKNYVLQTYARNYVNFIKGKNATLIDENKKEYIDFTSGIGVVSVGHGNKKVADKALKKLRSHCFSK